MRGSVSSLVLLSSLLASGAQAQWAAPHPRPAEPISGDVPVVMTAEMGFHHQTSRQFLGITASGYAVPMRLAAFATFAEMIEAGFVWGFGLGHLESAALSLNETQVVGFNPYLQGAYRVQTDDFLLRVGGGMALPLTPRSDASAPGFTLTATQAYSAAMDGLSSAWLFAPDRLTLVLPTARIDSLPEETLVWSGETALGLGIYTGNAAGQETEVYWQLAGEIGGRFAERFVAGMRLSLVVALTGDFGNGDAAQLAAQPFFRAHFDPFFASFRFTMNIDEPFGFAFDEGKVWGLFLGGGAYL